MDSYETMEHLIDYHSHPKGCPEEFIRSNGDMKHVKSVIETVKWLMFAGAPIKDVYFVL